MRKRIPYFAIFAISLLLLLLIFVLIRAVFFTQQHTNTKGKGGVATATPSPQKSPTPLPTAPANIDFEPIDSYGTYSADALANPNIGAVDINMNWVNVEPQQGVFNWEPADNEFAAWSKQGKKVVFIVRYIKESTSGTDCSSPQYLPTWEIARIQHFCDSDVGTVIPDYFGSTFKADLKSFVSAIAAHYANSPYRNNLLYVRIGLGEGGEGFPLWVKGDYDTVDLPQLEDWGYTPANWANWQKEMLTSYKSSFYYTPVIYPLNGLDTDLETGQPVQVEVAVWAAANGFGIGQQGLQPGTESPLFQQLRSQYPKMYIQYQTIEVVNTFKGIRADIRAADANGAQFIEWYSEDITNPEYQSLFAEWQQTVNKKFGAG